VTRYPAPLPWPTKNFNSPSARPPTSS
jgi:hypothetical protein